MGGKSSIIDLNLYRNTILSMRKEKTIDKMIENQIDIEFQFQIEQLLNNRRLEGRTDDNWNVQEMLFWRKIEKRRYELYQLLYKGELDFDEIDRNYSKYYLCSEYKTMNELLSFRKNQFFESYPFSDEVAQRVMDMSCYASFSEYYTKVLKRN